MQYFILIFITAVMTSQSAQGKLSDRAKRILGKQDPVTQDSLTVTCDSDGIDRQRTIILKQTRPNKDELTGSQLMEKYSSTEIRKATFEVRIVYGKVQLKDEKASEEEKFNYTWKAAQSYGTANFTRNSLGQFTFVIDQATSTLDRVLSFASSKPDVAKLKTGNSSLSFFDCELKVIDDSKLNSSSDLANEDEECAVQESDPDCIESSEAKD